MILDYCNGLTNKIRRVSIKTFKNNKNIIVLSKDDLYFSVKYNNMVKRDLYT